MLMRWAVWCCLLELGWLLEAGRTGQAGSHSPRARNPPYGNGEVDQRLPAPQLPRGRKSKWKLGRLKWSKWEHGKPWGTQGWLKKWHPVTWKPVWEWISDLRYHSLGALSHRYLLLTFLEAGSLRSGCWHGPFLGEDHLPGLQKETFYCALTQPFLRACARRGSHLCLFVLIPSWRTHLGDLP